MVSSYVPGAESRKPYNWTAGDLMSGLEEFLGDAFRIAHILDGTPFKRIDYPITLKLLSCDAMPSFFFTIMFLVSEL